MVNDAIKKLYKSLEDIEQYIKGIKICDDMVLENLQSKDSSALSTLDIDISSMFINKKIFTYRSLVISLYSSFESFIEEVIIEYLECLVGVVKTYNELPPKVRANHIEYSTVLLKNIRHRRYAGRVTECDIIKNLYDSLHNNPFKLNYIAFTQHSANLRHSIVHKLLDSIDISLSKIKKEKVFIEYMSKNFGFAYDSSSYKLSDEFLFQKLTDLANRRNEVSHSIEINNIFSVDIFNEYLYFIKYYCKAINRLLEDSLIKYKVSQEYFKKLDEFHIFNNNILGIRLNNIYIRLGDFIYFSNADNHYKAKITSIEVNKKRFNYIRTAEPLYVGIKLETYGIKIKKGFSVYMKLAS